MSVFKRGNWWWYELMYKGVRIRASSKSTDRTVAERAEVKKRWELDHPDEACFVYPAHCTAEYQSFLSPFWTILTGEGSSLLRNRWSTFTSRS